MKGHAYNEYNRIRGIRDAWLETIQDELYMDCWLLDFALGGFKKSRQGEPL